MKKFLQMTETKDTKHIDLEKILAVPKEPVSGVTRAGLQIGFQLMNEPETDQQRDDLKYLRSVSQDLEPFKDKDGRIPIAEKKRIIQKFCPKYSANYMDFLVEVSFIGRVFLLDDGR